MNNIKNFYKKQFDDIKIDFEESNNVYDYIIIRKYNKWHLKPIMCLFIVFVIVIIGLVNANAIKNIVNNSWIEYIFNDKGNNTIQIISNKYIEVNDNGKFEEVSKDICTSNNKSMSVDKFTGISNVNNSCYMEYSFDEYEDELKIKILRSNLYKNNKLILYELKRKNTKISNITLLMNNVYDINPNDEKYIDIDLSIGINSDEDDNDRVIKYFDLSVNNAHEYKLNHLNTTALIWDLNKELNLNNRNYGQARVFLTYNGVLYRYDILTYGSDTSVNEAYKLLDSLYIS